MANKDLLEQEKIDQTRAFLEAIGEEEYSKARGGKAEGLRDALSRKLTPRIRSQIAQALVDIALDRVGDSGASAVRTRLEAIREIYDRVEGKSKVSATQASQEQDPFLRMLAEVMAEEPKSIAPGVKQNYIDSPEVRILDEQS